METLRSFFIHVAAFFGMIFDLGFILPDSDDKDTIGNKK